MKKIIAMLLVLVMALSLVACGTEKPVETKAPEAGNNETQAPATEAAPDRLPYDSPCTVYELPYLGGILSVPVDTRYFMPFAIDSHTLFLLESVILLSNVKRTSLHHGIKLFLWDIHLFD